jgi:F-type H+-transporting ATPase subunit delta
MAGSGAAQRYARALFQIAQEEGRVAPIRNELESLGRLLRENDELRAVLVQPLHPAPERRAVLAKVAERIGASPVVRSFYAYLIDRRRLVDFEAIEAEFARLADRAAGLTEASVRSASAFSPEQAERLRQALAARIGGEVRLSFEVDASLLGGVVAQVGDTVYDGSLRTQLERLRSGLLGD